MQLNSIWSVSSKHEDGLETIHNHQTQDQRVRTFWSLPVQGMEFAPVQGMAGNFQYNLHSRIVLRLYDCKWKILCKVDCCQNIHYQAFWKCHVITKSCCRAVQDGRLEVQNDPPCTSMRLCVPMCGDERMCRKGKTNFFRCYFAVYT